MKIAAFKNMRSDADAEENGKWVDVAPGIQWKMRRLRSKTVSAARRKIYGPQERAMNGKELPDAIETMCTIRLLSEAVVTDWRGEEMKDEETGQPIPFSKETCATLLSDAETGKDLRALVISLSNDSEIFSVEDAEADAGN